MSVAGSVCQCCQCHPRVCAQAGQKSRAAGEINPAESEELPRGSMGLLGRGSRLHSFRAGILLTRR